MFFRLKAAGKYHYLQLVENHYLEHRTIQRVLCTVGQWEELQTTGGLDVLLNSLERFVRQAREGRRHSLNPKTLDEPWRLPEAVSVPGGDLPPQTLQPLLRLRPNSAGKFLTLDPVAPKAPSSVVEAEMFDILRKSMIFSDLDDHQLVQLALRVRHRRARAGQFLYLQGYQTESCYIIVSGMIKVTMTSVFGSRVITGFYGAGEMLGNLTLLLDKPRGTSAQALVDSELLIIDTKDLLTFLERHPHLIFKTFARMLNLYWVRHHAACFRFNEQTGGRTAERLSRVLLALSLKFGRTIPLTRAEIAEMAGTTTETATRFTSRLAKTGAIETFRGKVVVLEPDKLRRLGPVSAPGLKPRPHRHDNLTNSGPGCRSGAN